MPRSLLVILSGLLLLLCTSSAQAHDHHRTTWTLKDLQGQVQLSVNFPQATIHQEFFRLYGKPGVRRMNRAAYEELVVSYFKEHAAISAAGESLGLREVSRSIEDHESSVTFKVVDPDSALLSGEARLELDAFASDAQQRHTLVTLSAAGEVIAKQSSRGASSFIFSLAPSTDAGDEESGRLWALLALLALCGIPVFWLLGREFLD